MQCWKNKILGLSLVLGVLSTVGCGGGSSNGGELNPPASNEDTSGGVGEIPSENLVLPTVSLAEGKLERTVVIQPQGSFSIVVLLSTPEGFSELSIVSSQGENQSITDVGEESEGGFKYEFSSSLDSKADGETESFVFVVKDQAGGSSEPLQVTVHYRRPVLQYSTSLRNANLGPQEGAFVNFTKGEVYSVEDAEPNPMSVQAHIDAFYYSTEQQTTLLLSPASDEAQGLIPMGLLWEGSHYRTTLFKVIDQGFYEEVNDLGEGEQVEFLDQVYEEAAPEQGSPVADLSLLFPGKALAFKTAAGKTGILVAAPPSSLSVAIKWWVNQ